jgi:hypothetical protein
MSLPPARHTPYLLGSNSDVAEVDTESRSSMSEVTFVEFGALRDVGEALPKMLTGTTGVL